MKAVKTLYLFFSVLLFITSQSCSTNAKYSSLQDELDAFVMGKNANIGIGIIIDSKDTISVNGDSPFPMMSVYKLPIAIAYGDHFRVGATMDSEEFVITSDDLKPDTYSPMREKYAGQDTVTTSIHEVLAYALQQSDNNASDIIIGRMGGVDNVRQSMRRLGFENINVISTEDEMHTNPDLCYQNTSTPIAMASMLNRFDREFDDCYTRNIKRLMESCETGKSRLAKPLLATNAVIGHKTGTGFPLPNGRISAINDVGYVHLSNGHNYTIAVFIENSGYSLSETEALIATISEIVYFHIK